MPAGASYYSLAGVMAFFASPVAATAGWIHYLVFDLFVGAWLARDAQRRGVAHWLVIPCLIVTLMAGPVGLAAYLVLRTGLGKGGFCWPRPEDRAPRERALQPGPETL